MGEDEPETGSPIRAAPADGDADPRPELTSSADPSAAPVPSPAPTPSPTSAAPRAANEPSGRARAPLRGPRPDLSIEKEALYREAAGFRLRLEPPDLARLRELPGSKGKTDRELGEEFFEAHSGRFAAALAGDVAPPAEVRVVVDPYSRQAFLAVENRIRDILSF